jgi:hypothetical protein
MKQESMINSGIYGKKEYLIFKLIQTKLPMLILLLIRLTLADIKRFFAVGLVSIVHSYYVVLQGLEKL